jgi:hypothetical protein
MKSIPYWVQGGMFAVALVLLIFILKITCPLNIGCFADPFLIPLFSPLLIIGGKLGSLSAYEPFFVITFWAMIGALIGLFAGKIWGNDN